MTLIYDQNMIASHFYPMILPININEKSISILFIFKT